uniref:E3 ubiquitin-protein ligase sh3rf3 n=1 Tax=Sphaerodactylus townsendi TaxID=933632 RepID=A0ACB8FIQ5_9SAUR
MPNSIVQGQSSHTFVQLTFWCTALRLLSYHYEPCSLHALNESAKQLIETDKTNLAAASGSDVSLPADINLAVNTAQCCTLNSAGAVSAIQRHIDGKKNTKKRHSFTALSMTHKSSQALNNRHSMEISAPVLISSSDPRAAARIGDVAHLSSSAPVQVNCG